MTPTSGSEFISPDKEKYLNDWARMMVTIWKDKMVLYHVGESKYTTGEKKGQKRASGRLKDSLAFLPELDKQSGGDTAKISHVFLLYGMYLDGGVFPGRGGLGQNHRSNHNRIPQPWRELSYGVSKRILKEKMLELTGSDFLFAVHRILVGNIVAGERIGNQKNRKSKNGGRDYARAKGR